MSILQIQMTPAGEGGADNSYHAFRTPYTLVCKKGVDPFCEQVVRLQPFCDKRPMAYNEHNCNPNLATNKKFEMDKPILF